MLLERFKENLLKIPHQPPLSYYPQSFESNMTLGQRLAECIKCVICLDSDLTIALKECGHVVSCLECAPKLPKECPICRAPNTGTLKIFFP